MAAAWKVPAAYASGTAFSSMTAGASGVNIALDGAYAGRQSVGGLAAGAVVTVQQGWIATPGQHSVTVTVDEYDAVYETDEANTTAPAALPL